MHKFYLLLILALWVPNVVHSAALIKMSEEALEESQVLSRCLYTREDSLEVVRLLRKDVGKEDILFYARHFIGRPYVAHTLEVADPEKIVVNLRQFDCATFVETVCALALTKRQNSDRFSDYCASLEKLRYWGGRCKGYCSRLHYLSWWIRDNAQRGNIQEVCDSHLFKKPMIVNNFYMSRYPSKYVMLRKHPSFVKKISFLENKNNGDFGFYLDKALVNDGQQRLSALKSGDLVAIVTTMSGLDFSHQGFAVWGNDGKLHLLHASSIYKKVVETKESMYDYLKRNKRVTGVKIIRLE